MNWYRRNTLNVVGSVPGTASVLGSWQICHSVCIALVALLGFVGITVTGMPLFFLNRWVIPIWLLALFLWGITIFLYFHKKCIRKSMLLLNGGLVLAGVPFSQLQQFTGAFWIGGGSVALTGILILIHEKYERKKCHER